MKSLKLTLIALTILVSCKEDKNRKPFPLCGDPEITNINEDGASFNSSILEEGSSDIVDHGFLWKSTESELLWDTISLGQRNSYGSFSARVEYNLENGIDYKVRAFIQGSDSYHLSKETIFTSKGCKSHTITDFTPKLATWGDTISITGTNFSKNKSKIKILFGKFPGKVIQSDFGAIKAIVPHELDTTSCKIGVEIAGNDRIFEHSLNIKKHEFHRLVSNNLVLGDTIKIKGKFFNSQHTKVTIKDFSFRSQVPSDTLIYIFIDKLLKATINDIKISFSNHSITIPDKIYLKIPEINDFDKNGALLDTVSLYGINFRKNKIKVFVSNNKVSAKIINISNSTIQYQIPTEINYLNDSIPIYVEFFNQITKSFKIKIDPPVVSEIYPKESLIGDTITIKGDNFIPEFYYIWDHTSQNYKINVNDVSVKPFNIRSGELQFIMPNTSNNDNIEVSVYYKGLSSNNVKVDLVPLKINEIYPKRLNMGEYLTIIGTGFNNKANNFVSLSGPNSLFFKDQIISKDTIRARIELIDPIESKKHNFKLYGNGQSTNFNLEISCPWKTVTTIDKHDYYIPICKNEENLILRKDTEIYSLNLNNYNLSKTGNYPESHNRNTYHFYINENLYLGCINTSNYLKSDDSWIKKAKTQFEVINFTKAFSINSSGFIINNYKIYEYSPDLDKWDFFCDLPNDALLHNGIINIVNNTAYISFLTKHDEYKLYTLNYQKKNLEIVSSLPKNDNISNYIFDRYTPNFNNSIIRIGFDYNRDISIYYDIDKNEYFVSTILGYKELYRDNTYTLYLHYNKILKQDLNKSRYLKLIF